LKKLKATKSALKFWNSYHFGNIQKKIASSLYQLDFIQQSSPSNYTFEHEALLQKSLDDLLIQEESLWQNKSREVWLTCKDLNTKFFHTSTIIKRQRNAINFLKLPQGSSLPKGKLLVIALLFISKNYSLLLLLS
jgi:hypothetical protein